MLSLFSKFVSKSFEGTGLGLYISKSIVEAHGGKIWAENNSDGKGATFTFTLPLNRRQVSIKQQNNSLNVLDSANPIKNIDTLGMSGSVLFDISMEEHTEIDMLIRTIDIIFTQNIPSKISRQKQECIRMEKFTAGQVKNRIDAYIGPQDTQRTSS
ncbi:MAG TPA: ATP-binding protein [Nitrososphaeraceae archaeon]|nr:ATP-binding protein [Nitrososphaeraceae archaeon]